VLNKLGTLPFIAEDLGIITPDVSALRDQFQIPGTRVLQFAFDGHSDNPHLPDNYPTNTVVYTGTHDNATTREWFGDLPDRERGYVKEYLRLRQCELRDAAPEFVRLAWSSRAALAFAPLQDLLNLGTEGRMNVPGRAEGNWRWRATRDMLFSRNFEWLSDLTRIAKRWGPAQLPVMEAAS
jgi:4-alpha-glucanotransferase